MKIRKIAFKNHPIFGNLNLDFTDKDGNVINTIILAGENGVGKSLLLNSIFEFSNLTLDNRKRDEGSLFEIELSRADIQVLQETNSDFRYFLQGNSTEACILLISRDYNIVNNWEQIKIKCKYKNEIVQEFPGFLFTHGNASSALRTIFSDVEINFTPSRIQSVTSSNIDKDTTKSERSTSNLATEITQLLIDIQSLDALEFSEWARNNSGQKILEDKLDVRIKRFTTAFDYMFPSKKYKRVENFSGHKRIIFAEGEREMDISQLSSGEKQIVFRGSFLLKDKESSKGALILIDEPEISLHPSWQLKVLSFFKKLFTDKNGDQTSQLIISTHSPFIIHNANRSDDKVIVLKKDDNGQTFAPEEPKFFTWSSEQLVKEAFNVSHEISNNTTTVFVEGETDEKYYNKCLEVFGKTDMPIKFKWIGRINDRGNAENTGDTALNQAKTFFTANPEHLKNRKVILFYDNDTNKPEEEHGNLIVRKMIKNPDNRTFKIGVENLLTLVPEINLSEFYKVNIKTDDYGAESIFKALDKTKLCSYICDTLDRDQQAQVLEKLNLEIDRVLAQAT